MFERLMYSLSLVIFIVKVDLKAGSSKHGKALRAAKGSN